MRSAVPVDAIELRASGQAPTPGSGHRLRSQSLALLVAAALEDEAPGLRLHPLAEAVGASPLALLGLIRALHAKPQSSQRPSGEFHARCRSTHQSRVNMPPTSCILALPLEPDRRTPPLGGRLALPEDLQTKWEEMRDAMRAEVTDFIFHVWLEPLEPAGRVGDKLFIRAPGHV